MKKVAVMLPMEQVARLEQISKDSLKPVSALIRESVQDLIERYILHDS